MRKDAQEGKTRFVIFKNKRCVAKNIRKKLWVPKIQFNYSTYSLVKTLKDGVRTRGE